LSLVISIIASAVILIKIGHTSLRYYLTFIVFAAPLAGFWICYLEKKKFAAVAAICLLSLVSMTALSFNQPLNSTLCTTIVSDTPPSMNKIPLAALFCPSPPDTRNYILDELISEIPPQESNKTDAKLLFFLAEPESGIPFGVEFIHESARNKQMRIRAMPFCMSDPIKNLKHSIEIESTDDKAVVVIVFKTVDSYQRLMISLYETFGKIELMGKFIDIGSGYYARITRVNKKV
jgi:hypothetical protein